jgi:hypothetical protein
MDISADSLTTDAVPGSAYTAIADVTAEVAAGGAYTVGGIRTTSSGPAGWSLIVMTHDDSQPLRQLLIVAPNAFVTPVAPYSLIAAAPAPTSDVHLVVSAFGGTALTGDVVTLDGLAVAGAFHGAITSTPRLPELAFNNGVDLLDVSAADVGSGSGALTISSSDDSVLVAAVGLAVDIV